ncbi:MAG: LLM class flavin-dependent oxidoreductase [Micrococcales bacterium]|nr:LLM class flavin-dependent oxidoreductase [Micrococcales bacterium]
MTPRLGFTFVPGFPPSALRPIATATEAVGLDELWVWEDCFKESGIASAALALGATERIAVGIGLMPTPLRNVALTAMELATIEGAIPDRLIGGIGHGVLPWMAQVGGRVASPVTLLREYAAALRPLLGGQRVTVDGRYVHLDDVALDWPPARRVPVLIGAGGPKGVRLSGELADGLIIAGGRSRAQVTQARGWAREGGADADAPVIVSLMVALGDDAAQRLTADLAVFGDAGAPEEAAVTGTAEQVAERVLAYAAAGATTVTFQPTLDEQDVEGLLGFLGEEVAPLVRGA